MTKQLTLGNLQVLKQTAQYLRDRLDIFNALRLSEQDATNIAGSLHNYPARWLHISREHPLFPRADKDICELFPELEAQIYAMYVDTDTRNCLVIVDNTIFPIVFKHSLDCTAIYRLILQDTVRWLPTWLASMDSMYSMCKHATSLTASTTSTPMEDLTSRKTGAGLHLQLFERSE